jgi:hypothetical protein
MSGPVERLNAVGEFRPVASVASAMPVVPDRYVGAGMIVGHE